MNYHSSHPEGKIEVVPTKSLSTQHDLALAYSPGVAEPCLAIADNPDDAYKYTSKGNLVAVISNGSAVLGLGNIGAVASKPVMEGKGVLFKKFAGIDVFDIEIDSSDPEEFVKIIKSLEPTFGGINLEDIKAPESFFIESRLKDSMNIPVMHDDQHGTAIISAAGLINALELVNKKIEEVQIVINGAGASAIACANLYISIGARKENILMLDSKGCIRVDRDNVDEIKAQFATTKDIHSLEEAMNGADVFIGLSKGNVVTPDMLKSMSENPIVFALANPDPEIPYEDAMKARKDIIMATGRSDHPNQINNVLGFPYIFRGALDVRASAINEEMKLAAVKAIAQLAKEQVPELVTKAYGLETLNFGPEYLIPKPMDPRLITTISPAVARAAMETGVARTEIIDWEYYRLELLKRIGINEGLISRVIIRARRDPKRVVFAEADDVRILKAAQLSRDEGICFPILLGNYERIHTIADQHKIDIEGCKIIDSRKTNLDKYAKLLFEKRQRKGLTPLDCQKMMRERNYFGSALVELGEADAFISGLTRDYPNTVKPALQVIGVRPDVKKVAGMYIINSKRGSFFFADTTVNANPSAEDLVDIVGLTAKAVRFFDVEPRIAMLSYSNFGSNSGSVPEKVKEATARAKQQWPDLIIDGDIQANIALNTDIQKEMYPFSLLAEEGANTFIFPNLSSGNIAYKLLMEIGGAEAIGPVLLGMNKPVHVVQLGSTVSEIFNMVAISVVDAQDNKN